MAASKTEYEFPFHSLSYGFAELVGDLDLHIFRKIFETF
jgi:hypothetical protein